MFQLYCRALNINLFNPIIDVESIWFIASYSKRSLQICAVVVDFADIIRVGLEFISYNYWLRRTFHLMII